MKKTEIALVTLIVIVCVFRFFTKIRDDAFLSTFNDKKISAIGSIVEEPDFEPKGSKLIVAIEKISLASGTETLSAPFGTKHLVSASVRTSLDLKYGDRIMIKGSLEKPQIITDENGQSFDYPHYLGKDDIYYLLKGDQVEIKSSDQGSKFKSFLLEIKDSFIKQIDKSLPEPYSLLANGLIVAGKGILGEELNDEFKRVGLIHIVVLSGSNVTIVAEAMTTILSFLPKAIAAFGGVFGIVCFSIIAGTSATVVRAAIMSIIAVIGHAIGRDSDALRSIVIAASIMSMINPDLVIYDPSFQLSFIGTLGLILFGNKIEQRLVCIPDRFGLREIIAASLTSQLSLTPMILHLSGVFSVVALLTNILIVPLVPLTMLFVFVTGCTSFMSPVLAVPTAIVSYVLLKYELSLVGFFSAWNLAAINLKPLSWLGVLVVYVLYAFIYMSWKIYKKSRRRGDGTLVKQLEMLGEKPEG